RDGQDMLRPATQPAPQLEIRKAVYGVLDGPDSQKIEVTARVAELASDGWPSISAGNGLAGQDPARNVPKQLRVEYLIEGEAKTGVVDEGETLQWPDLRPQSAPPVELRGTGGNATLIAWENGAYRVARASGKPRNLKVNSIPAPLVIDGPWELRFPEKSGA